MASPDYVTDRQLIHAVLANDLKSTKELFQGGADINIKQSNGWTLLHAAALKGLDAIVQTAIDNGAEVNARSDIGWSALHSAAFKGHKNCIQILINHGADVNAKTTDGSTVLHFVAKHKNTNLVHILINHGANINAQTSDGLAVIHQAAKSGNDVCIQILIEKGVDLSVKDNQGRTAVDVAKSTVIDMLISKGAPANLTKHTPKDAVNLLSGNKSSSPNAQQNISDKHASVSLKYETKTYSPLLPQRVSGKSTTPLPNENSNGSITQQNKTVERVTLTSGSKMNSYGLNLQQKYSTGTIRSAGGYENTTTNLYNHTDTVHLKQQVSKLQQDMSNVQERVDHLETREIGPLLSESLRHVFPRPRGKDMVGKGYMPPDMKKIFNKENAKNFKSRLDPQPIIDRLFSKRVITDAQLQDLKSLPTDIRKANYLWELMKLDPKYLKEVRDALVNVNQGQLGCFLR